MSDTPDVVFVILDSVRKERVSAYGHHRETTPAFDALAAEATIYENAYTPAPWTLPSHCSMFTGRFPSEHGITNGFTDRNLELSSDFPTFTQLLAEKGYATAGFSNNPWVGQLSGLNRGFDRFVEWDLEISRSRPSSVHRLRDAAFSRFHSVLGRAAGQPQAVLKRRFFTANLIDRAKQWMIDPGDRSRFTFLNLMEAHSPYYPPGDAFRDLGLDPPGLIEPRLLNGRLLAYIMGKSPLSAERRERVLEFYDASLRYQDGKLEELLGLLRSRGTFDDTMIVVCADHGKTLGDFDRDGIPPHYVRDINVNVPLLIKWPNQRRPARVDAPVELVDLFGAMANPGEIRELPTREDGALVEDHVPHTARSTTDVVRWRVLADRSNKYVQSDDGDEFLFENRTNETVVDVGPQGFDRYRDRLRDRVDSLDVPSTTMGEADRALEGALEEQLHDLGYLS